MLKMKKVTKKDLLLILKKSKQPIDRNRELKFKDWVLGRNYNTRRIFSPRTDGLIYELYAFMFQVLNRNHNRSSLLLNILTVSFLFALISSPSMAIQITCRSLFSNGIRPTDIRTLGQKPFPIRAVFIDEAENVMPLIREQLGQLGFKGSTILTRQIEHNHLEMVLKTGNDRDENSHVWHWARNTDATKEDHSRNKITAQQITYLQTLDISSVPALIVPLERGSYHESLNYERLYDQSALYEIYQTKFKNMSLEEVKAWWAKYVILIYRPDPDIFQRVAEYEHWIRDDARKSLLFAIVVGQNKVSMRERLDRESEQEAKRERE
jgi:hypothetical protein